MFITLKVKYFHRLLKPLEYIDGKSDWIDLRCAEPVTLEAGKFYMIPFGVAIKLPSGFEAHIVPRSSTFKKYGIIQTNGMGIIDNTYCGDDDQWMMPVYTTRDTTIYFNERIAQFRIVENQPRIKFKTVEHLNKKNRGGFGSTGRK